MKQQTSTPDPLEAHLGFGSLHFQATGAAPDLFTSAEYLGWIEGELRRIPSATVIEVEALDPAYADFVWTAPSPGERYGDKGIPYPPLQFCRVKFGLEIPQSVQAEVLEEDDLFGGSRPEDFIVSIQDGWQMPTAMVWPIGAREPDDGSNAVRLVREYLRSEVGLGRVSPIEFDCLGPSPAHFTIQLEEGAEEQQHAFDFLGREPAPYPNYIYSYRGDFLDLASAVDELHFEVSSQLDLIYRIEAARVAQLRGWAKAEEGARRILSAYEARGPKGAARRLVRGRDIGRIQIALVSVELNQSLDHKRLSREFEGDYLDPPAINIKQVVQDQLKGFETIQVEPLSRLLEALADARQTGRAVLIAAVASLIGAAVAAIATLVAS